MAGRYVILLDGGFVKRKLEQQLGRFPGVNDVLGLCQQVQQEPRLANEELFRIYSVLHARNTQQGSAVKQREAAGQAARC